MADVDPNLGAYIPREGNDPAATGGTWQDFVKANRPFLAGMGAQLMVGSPGNLLSNIGAGVAKGNESQNMTEEMNYERGVGQRKFVAGQEEGEKNRASHEKIAQTTADSREHAAEIRGRFSVDRANIALQKAHPNDAIKYRQEARKIVEGRVTNMGLDTQTVSRMIEDEAARMYASDVERGRVTPPAGSVTSGVGTPPAQGAGQPPTPGTAAPGTNGAPKVSKPWDQYVQTPGVEAALQDPKFRQDLGNAHPEYKTRIQMWEKSNGKYRLFGPSE